MSLDLLSGSQSLKDRVFMMLEGHDETPVAANEIAENLNITPEQLANTVCDLREDGVLIAGDLSSGYILEVHDGRLTKSGVENLLQHKYQKINDKLTVHIIDTVSSTNVVIKEFSDHPQGLVVAANYQTAGIGRLSRTFFSPRHSGLYFSMLLKPDMKSQLLSHLTPLAAVAVCRTIRAISNGNLEPSIKWVNDIFIRGKKVCGILVQSSFTALDSFPEYAILGIGINIFDPEGGFSPDIKDIAGSLFGHSDNYDIQEKFNQPIIRRYGIKNYILCELLYNICTLYDGYKWLDIANEYKENSFVIGKEVFILALPGTKPESEPCLATVIDIDENCNLKVRYKDILAENGQPLESILSSNEISIKPL